MTQEEKRKERTRIRKEKEIAKHNKAINELTTKILAEYKQKTFKNNGNYCVYIHINKINNKCYIGSTMHGNSPEKRFGKNGIGYVKSKYFWPDIQKYGWNNFEHINLKTNLCKDDAEFLEKYYIILFKSYNPNYGYNHNISGNSPSINTRQKISNTLKNKNKHTI